MKYVSDKYKNKSDGLLTVPKGSGFDDMTAAKGAPDIGDRVNKIIAKFMDKNDLVGENVIKVPDFYDEAKFPKKTATDTIGKLIAVFEKPELDFSKNRAEDDDILGDAYEYLMKNFASVSGKSKGQFSASSAVCAVKSQISAGVCMR